MKLVDPPVWYMAFWTALASVSLVGIYFVVKWAVLAAILEARR